MSGHVIMEKEGLVVAPGGIFEGAVEYVRKADEEQTAPGRLAIEAAV